MLKPNFLFLFVRVNMQQMFSEVWDKTLTVSYTKLQCNAKHEGHIFLLLTQLDFFFLYRSTYRIWNPHDFCGGVWMVKGALGCEL